MARRSEGWGECLRTWLIVHVEDLDHGAIAWRVLVNDLPGDAAADDDEVFSDRVAGVAAERIILRDRDLYPSVIVRVSSRVGWVGAGEHTRKRAW